ncbi:MAG: YggT family protein [Sphaerochaetaceae bacterium]|nr:YggT family protein [Sphaerochaetaceae bacterium]
MNFIRAICSILSWLVGVYSTIIVIRVIVSWVLTFSRRNGWRSGYGGYGYNQNEVQEPSFAETLDRILGTIADPYLNMFDNVTSLKRGNVDFTPLLALVLLNLVRSVLNVVAQAGSITLWLVFAIIVEGLWTLVSFVMVVMLILMIVRLVVAKGNSYQSMSTLNFIDSILEVPVSKIYKMFFRKKGQMDDQKLVIYSLIIYFILFVVLKAVERGLVNLLLSL